MVARPPPALTQAGTNVRKCTYVPTLLSIAAVGLRFVAQRLRLHAASARSSGRGWS